MQFCFGGRGLSMELIYTGQRLSLQAAFAFLFLTYVNRFVFSSECSDL